MDNASTVRIRTSELSVHRYWFVLAAILLAAMALRMVVVIAIPTAPVSDFWSYFQRAISLADRGVYEAIPGRPDASYPPGYPLLLSLFFQLPTDRLFTAKLVNIALGVMGLVLIAAITRILFTRQASLIAGVIYALNPRSILSCSLLASENLFIPLILLWIFLSIRKKAQISPWISMLCGFSLGLCTLTRSVSWLLVIPWIAWLLVRKIPTRQLFMNVAVFLLAQAIVLLPWSLRNSRVLGSSTFLTTTAGINLFIGNNPDSTGQWYPWVDDMQQMDPSFSERSIAGQDRIARNTAIDWIFQNPLKAGSLYLKKWRLIFHDENFVLETSIFGRQLSPPWPAVDVLENNSAFVPYRSLLEFIVNGFYWVFLISGMIGVIISWVRFHKDNIFLSNWLFLILTILYFPAVSAVFIASSRFHWPSGDLLIPFSGGVLSFAAFNWVVSKTSPMHQIKEGRVEESLFPRS
jgi:4-amino-4-deoxy-L-arabinose transferase-like glycosyltransferase